MHGTPRMFSVVPWFNTGKLILHFGKAMAFETSPPIETKVAELGSKRAFCQPVGCVLFLRVPFFLVVLRGSEKENHYCGLP